MAYYTDQERDTIRAATFGAVGLVSAAEPGHFDVVTEHLAASRALASAPESLRGVLRVDRIPMTASTDRAVVLASLTESARILAARSAEDLDAFRDVIAHACGAAAGAVDGVSDRERGALTEVHAAVGIV
ncbi:hypothetical protein AB0M43_09400 [Longispora sp. NPDC051575]|uniref:hypothetical protein n=1 Tax=Longispora sp. NPDC051575 TaxID=3154943 RepID=UPI003422103A